MEHRSSNPPLKVVCRILPPTLTETDLQKFVGQKFSSSVQWSRFDPGKISKTAMGLSTHSRAYFAFDTHRVADSFIRAMNGHTLVDERGESFKAIVTWAPHQKVPKTKRPDPKMSSIESDPVFVKFLEDLAAPVSAGEPPVSPHVLEIPKVTPLVQAWKERKSAKEKKLERKKAAAAEKSSKGSDTARWAQNVSGERPPRKPKKKKNVKEMNFVSKAKNYEISQTSDSVLPKKVASKPAFRPPTNIEIKGRQASCPRGNSRRKSTDQLPPSNSSVQNVLPFYGVHASPGSPRAARGGFRGGKGIDYRGVWKQKPASTSSPRTQETDD
eukprot:GHVP01058046.1.p1 GENE.GHVP01058046.1~~GHVP01058046.1.p1  ORF type:complete len:327 (-),score=70.96 GHVP01058046.1:339-1319(-)